MMSKKKQPAAVPASSKSPRPQRGPIFYKLCICIQNAHRLGPLAHLPLQASPVFGNILNQLFMVLHQQLMEPILLSFALAHRFRRQLQQLGAGLEESAGIAGGFGSFHLVSRQHPNLHTSCMQSFDRLC